MAIGFGIPKRSLFDAIDPMRPGGGIGGFAQEPEMGNMPVNTAPMQKRGGIFGSRSKLWDVVGSLGDAFAENGPVYAQQKMARQNALMEQERARQQMMQQQQNRQYERADWLFKQDYERQNPKPVNNDTVADYEYIRSRLGEAAANQYLRNKIDRPQTTIIDNGDGTKTIYQLPQGGVPQAPQRPQIGSVVPDPRKQGGAVSNGGNTFPKVSGNGVGVVQSLFPNARITSGYRGPDHPLSKKNPSSYHARTRGAVDIAPIPGMTFQQYVNSIKAAGHSIIEARDEVKNPSSHATGPHWHVVIGERR